jgi:hypothetical protein
MLPRTSSSPAIPAVAAGLALAYPAAVFLGPGFLPVVAAASAIAACALALSRRPNKALQRALVVIALWLAAGFVGAWVLRARPAAGAAWAVTVLFLAPMPLIPWLYARSFGVPGSAPDGDDPPREGPDPTGGKSGVEGGS